MNVMQLTPEQCRAARALLGWTPAQCGTSALAVEQFEAGLNPPCVYTLCHSFESAGVEMIAAEDGKGEGVRFYNSDRSAGSEGGCRPEWRAAMREWQIRAGVRARQALGDFSGKASNGPGAGEAFEEFPATL